MIGCIRLDAFKENIILTFALPWDCQSNNMFLSLIQWPFAKNFYFLFRFIGPSSLVPGTEMTNIDMRKFLTLMGEQLQLLDVEKLKYALKDSFTGKFLLSFHATEFTEKMIFHDETVYWVTFLVILPLRYTGMFCANNKNTNTIGLNIREVEAVL